MSGRVLNIYVRPGGRRLAGNTLWNLTGLCLPMLAAVFAIPVLIRTLGNARFGVLGLIWMLVGYFSIFDLGLGRALTKLAAARLGEGKPEELPKLFWTAMLFMLGLGCLLGVLLALFSPALAERLLNIPAELRAEARRSFYAVAAGMPVVIATTGLVGTLEAGQFFRQINYVRVPAGAFTFLGPLAVLPFTATLPAVVGVLIAGRLAETLAYFLLCLRHLPILRCLPRLQREMVGPLLRFGGWLTVSNLAMPFMAHVDRFFIGALVSMTAVAYYVTPAEVVIKLLIIPRAWVTVLFPAFSAGAAVAPEESTRLFGRGLRFLLGALAPVMLAMVALAPPALQIWLGEEYARHSAAVMQWLAMGVFLNAAAYVPFAFLQGLGRPDLAACLHLAELIGYAVLAPAMIRRFGIEGAAYAWCIRAGVDLACLSILALRLALGARAAVYKAGEAAGLALILAVVVLLFPHGWLWRAGVLVLVWLIFGAFYWFRVFESNERTTVLNFIKPRRP